MPSLRDTDDLPEASGKTDSGKARAAAGNSEGTLALRGGGRMATQPANDHVDMSPEAVSDVACGLRRGGAGLLHIVGEIVGESFDVL
jgi:hypothetical protein